MNNFYKDCFVEGYISSYLISYLSSLVKFNNDNKIEFPIEIEKEFPGFNPKIKEEILKLKDENYEDFYQNHEAFFLNSSCYNEVKNLAEKAYLKKIRKEEAIELIDKLKKEKKNLFCELNEIITLLFDFKGELYKIPDETAERISLANKLIKVDKSTSDEVINKITNKTDKNYITLRFENFIIFYKEYNIYTIVSLEGINIKKIWGIKKNNNCERIEELKLDKYSRIINL